MTLRILVVISTLAVLATKAGVPPDARVTEQVCRVEMSGRASGTNAGICNQISTRWSALFEQIPPGGAVQLVDQIGFHTRSTAGQWVLEAPYDWTNRGTSSARRSGGIIRYYAESVMPHEAGHAMLRLASGTIGLANATTQYGTQAPDWFDEGVAVWMESAEQRTKRTKDVIALKPSLSRLVTLEHPNIELIRASNEFSVSTRTVLPPCDKCVWRPDSLRRKYEITDVGTNRGGRPDTVVWYSDRNPTKEEFPEQKYFYPLAYSLLRFIHQRGGAHAVRELLNRYQIDPRPRVEVLSGLPGLPASVPSLEKEWHQFLAKMPAEKH